MNAKRIQILLTLASCFAGCTSAQIAAPDRDISTAQLLDGEVFPRADVPIHAADILALSDEMRAFVDSHMAGLDSPRERWLALSQAISTAEDLKLTYGEQTLTAAGAFAARNGNCLSYSAMLVALARYAGLPARFHEVDVPPDWTSRNGVVVRWRHINVLVDLGAHGEHVIDFDTVTDTFGYPGAAVDDARAVAHFFNNMGVEHLQAGDSGLAFAYFRQAIGAESTFTPAWNNLGALFVRTGFREHAVAAYQRAIELDPADFTAMNNLVGLYESQGNMAAADTYRARVARYRQENPYFHFGLARQAFAEGDLDAAERHLKNAIRRKRDEMRFRQLGDEIIRARHDTGRAQAVTPEPAVLAAAMRR